MQFYSQGKCVYCKKNNRHAYQKCKKRLHKAL